jgi:hypothetical protein
LPQRRSEAERVHAKYKGSGSLLRISMPDNSHQISYPFTMSLAKFLSDLFESGRVVVTSLEAPLPAEEVSGLLVSAEQAARISLAHTPPEFSPPVALWAARLFYNSCQFMVCRDAEEKLIKTVFLEKCPLPRSPATDYSADLVFQYLPDLIRMTRSLSAGDPFLEQLLALGRAWPLSSVGVPEMTGLDVSSFIDHPSLRQLYADRIIAASDVARLSDAKMDDAVRSSLGAFPHLSKSLAKVLETSASGETKLATV